MATLEDARKAAMSDITLLRALVKQKDGAGAKLIFATLPVIPIELDDKTSQVFYDKMTNLKAEISAENLVALYNSLEQHKETQPRPEDIVKKTRGIWPGFPGR